MTDLTNDEKQMLRASLQTYISSMKSKAQSVTGLEWTERERKRMSDILKKIDEDIPELT